MRCHPHHNPSASKMLALNDAGIRIMFSNTSVDTSATVGTIQMETHQKTTHCSSRPHGTANAVYTTVDDVVYDVATTGRIAGHLGWMLCLRSRFLTVLLLIVLKPGIVVAVNVAGIKRFCKCISQMWLSWRIDVTRGGPEVGKSQVLPCC